MRELLLRSLRNLDIPGPKNLIGYIKDDIGTGTEKGFFGELPGSELITGTRLMNLVGLTAGSVSNPEPNWLKFLIDGKIIFVAKKNIRYNLSWLALNDLGIVYGEKVLVINGIPYRVRLLKGMNPDNSVATLLGEDTVTSHNSEWNRLLYNVAARDVQMDVRSSQIGSNWTEYPQDNTLEGLNISDGFGGYSWCQETTRDGPDYRVLRGRYAVSSFRRNTNTLANTSYGWRPVLEVIK